MKKLIIICVTAIIGSSFSVYSGNSPAGKEPDIIKLLGLSDAIPQSARDLYPLSKPAGNASSIIKDSVESNFKLKIDDFKKIIISIYDEHFSGEDIKRLISFYESNTGKKYNAVTSLINTKNNITEPVQNTSPEKKRDIIKLIAVTDARSQIEQIVELMGSFVTDGADTAVETESPAPDIASISKITDTLKLNIDKYFSHDEIKRLIRFFESPLGKKLTTAALSVNHELLIFAGELLPQVLAPTAQHKIAARRGIELSAAALSAAPFLFFERDSKGYLLPGDASLEKSKSRAAYQPHDKILVNASDKKNSYKLGDTVDVLKPIKVIPFKGKSAQIVSRQGQAVVVGHTGKQIVVKLINMWGMIQGGERIAPAGSFKTVNNDLSTGTGSQIQASVAARVEETLSPYLHQFFIIDKGADAGVNLGDFFKVFEKAAKNKLSEELLEAQVVNVSANSSTLVIQKIFKGSLSVGDQAFLSHKASR
ncbi:MAG: DUF2059 domain-containing protein [Chitinispirillales bacterium]|jgi:hypothetical protein|nr:DUF2059 domain-containing protein [Chitinispirillales bacterium]